MVIARLKINDICTVFTMDFPSVVAQWWRTHLPMQEMESVPDPGRSHTQWDN